jgi:hypothetical protein
MNHFAPALLGDLAGTPLMSPWLVTSMTMLGLSVIAPSAFFENGPW